MGYLIRVIGIVLFITILVGCGSDRKIDEAVSPNKSEATTEEKGKETGKDETSNEKNSTSDEYPMPVLAGWEEIEIVFKRGNIDIWHGEFSFEGEIDDYFEPYQGALTDMGFDIEITQDSEGMKSLSFTKVINGDKHVGNVLFTDNWVKSSLQYFQ